MLAVGNYLRYKQNDKWGLMHRSNRERITDPIYDDVRRIKSTIFLSEI